MITEITDNFIENSDKLKEYLASRPAYYSYKELVELVIRYSDIDEYRETPDPTRIHEINDGDYQGTLVFVIGSTGYHPDTYWYVMVGYGSCSGCDTLEAINSYSEEPATPQQVQDYYTLCLHIAQGLRLME